MKNQNENTITNLIAEILLMELKNAFNDGAEYVVVKSKELHDDLVSDGIIPDNRYPLVCGAMKQVMSDYDEYLEGQPSGTSRNEVIKYYKRTL